MKHVAHLQLGAGGIALRLRGTALACLSLALLLALATAARAQFDVETKLTASDAAYLSTTSSSLSDLTPSVHFFNGLLIPADSRRVLTHVACRTRNWSEAGASFLGQTHQKRRILRLFGITSQKLLGITVRGA